MSTYVIDQNMMQVPRLAARIADEPDARFVLPDVAFIEMSKHADWELTMTLALRHLTAAAPRVEMSTSISEGIQYELGSRRPITPTELLPEQHSALARDVMRELSRDTRSPRWAEIADLVGPLRSELLTDELDANQAKEQTKRAVDILLARLKPAVLTALRRPGVDHGFVLCFIQTLANMQLEESLVDEHGFSREAADRFLAARPLTLRHRYLALRHNVLTALKGKGWVDIDAARELNNQLDQHYALLATYFDGLFSDDKGASDAHRDLLVMLSKTPAEAATIALDGLNTINATRGSPRRAGRQTGARVARHQTLGALNGF
jgi:hypothetical protein